MRYHLSLSTRAVDTVAIQIQMFMGKDCVLGLGLLRGVQTKTKTTTTRATLNQAKSIISKRIEGLGWQDYEHKMKKRKSDWSSWIEMTKKRGLLRNEPNEPRKRS